MDCEKFEDALMDELYGELDELTSAALRRHASGCARCSERLASLRATRKVISASFLPVEAPLGLEARIVAAAAEARKVVPIRSRAARFVSIAGRWAMRPQTAMAAVFLLILGSSVLQLRSRAGSASSVVVTERGAPAENAPADSVASEGEFRGAANAHGTEQAAAPAASAYAAAPGDMLGKASTEPAPVVASVAPPTVAPAAPAPTAVAMAETEKKSALPRAAMQDKTAAADDLFAQEDQAARGRAASGAANAPSDRGSAGGGAAVASRPAKVAAAAPASPTPARKDESDAPSAGSFDASAALRAARNQRDDAGCASAVSQFDRVSSMAFGTQAGYDATFDAGVCYQKLGSYEVARARFTQLLTVPSYEARARAQLDALNARSKPAASRPVRQ